MAASGKLQRDPGGTRRLLAAGYNGRMLKAIGLGGLTAGSLVLGALLAFAHTWSRRQIGIVLAFGAGALISAVSVELVVEGVDARRPRLDSGRSRRRRPDVLPARRRRSSGASPAARARRSRSAPSSTASPSSSCWGSPSRSGGGVGIGLVVAIFISNVPEATGSAADLVEGGTSRRRVLALWSAVAAVCTAATVVGWAISSSANDATRAIIDGFAAGALLVMLIDSMIPDARAGAGRVAGLVATLGFAVAAGLSSLS